eukprot:gene16694-13724_t
MPNTWMEALKEYNKGKAWCVYRRGSKEYDEVKKIQDRIKKPLMTEDRRVEQEAPKPWKPSPPDEAEVKRQLKAKERDDQLKLKHEAEMEKIEDRIDKNPKGEKITKLVYLIEVLAWEHDEGKHPPLTPKLKSYLAKHADLLAKKGMIQEYIDKRKREGEGDKVKLVTDNSDAIEIQAENGDLLGFVPKEMKEEVRPLVESRHTAKVSKYIKWTNDHDEEQIALRVQITY